MNEISKWTMKIAQLFGDEPVMEPEDPKVVESSATKAGSNMDLLSTFIWSKLEEKSHDKLLTVCKK